MVTSGERPSSTSRTLQAALGDWEPCLLLLSWMQELMFIFRGTIERDSLSLLLIFFKKKITRNALYRLYVMINGKRNSDIS